MSRFSQQGGFDCGHITQCECVESVCVTSICAGLSTFKPDRYINMADVIG